MLLKENNNLKRENANTDSYFWIGLLK